MVNAVWGNNRCLQLESYETHKYKMKSYLLLKQVGLIVTIVVKRVNELEECVLISRKHNLWAELESACWNYSSIISSMLLNEMGFRIVDLSDD
jgi:hypothetical protein